MSTRGVNASVQYSISIGGKTWGVDKKKYISSISVTPDSGGADSAEIKLNDIDSKFIGDSSLIKRTPVSIRMWVLGYTQVLNFDGAINSCDVSFNDNGYPTISIGCIDLSYPMTDRVHTMEYPNRTRAELVRALAKRYGFGCSIVNKSFNREDKITQNKQTDLEFMKALANGEKDDWHEYICKVVRGNILFLEKGVVSSPKMTLYYKSGTNDIVSFSPKTDVDLYGEEESIVSFTNKTENNTTTGTETWTTIYYTSPKIEGDVKIIPSPVYFNLNISDTIDLKGFGSVYSGSYWVSKLKHTIDSKGLSQTISVYRKSVQKINTSSGTRRGGSYRSGF